MIDSEEEGEKEEEQDSDYGGSSKKKKRGKKRKQKEGGKGKKKKKRKKAESEVSDIEAEEEQPAVEETPKTSKRVRKSAKVSETSTPKEASPEQSMPTVGQLCEQYGLKDVDLEYSEADYSNLTTYKLFQQTYRQRIQAENPKVPVAKLMMLVGAKWREFVAAGPEAEQEEGGSEQQEQEEEEEEEEEEAEVGEEEDVPLSNRGRRSRGARTKKKKDDEDFDFDDEEESDDGGRRKSRGRAAAAASSAKKGKGKKAVPKLKIKLGGRKKRGSSEDEEEDTRGGKDSDEEFEEMLKEAETDMGDADVQITSEKKKPRGKAKMKIGNKNKKKGKKKKDFTQDEADHQEYCDVCQQGGEIILCDTCPKAYHLVCLDPELDEAPEGKWSCPHCEKNGPANIEESEDDEHMEFCRTCKEGGELLCCDSCPNSYHLRCVEPPLEEVPEGSWTCHRCACEPLIGKVEKILTWRWKGMEEEKEEDKKEEPAEGKKKKRRRNRIPKDATREFFVKWKDMSYWHCAWIQEIQLDVFHPQTYRMYLRKNDMDEPQRFDEEGDNDDGMSRRLKHHKQNDPLKLYERFYRYGIRPTWLQISRVLNKRVAKDGTVQYLIKWTDLGYAESTWEDEDEEIPDFAEFVQNYEDLRYVSGVDGSRKKKKKRKGEGDEDERPRKYNLPPDKPVCNLDIKYKDNDACKWLPKGLALHPYQLEGISWARHSWNNNTDIILADEMGLGKTIQTISLFSHLCYTKNIWGPFLVVAPTVTLHNWR